MYKQHPPREEDQHPSGDSLVPSEEEECSSPTDKETLKTDYSVPRNMALWDRIPKVKVPLESGHSCLRAPVLVLSKTGPPTEALARGLRP